MYQWLIERNYEHIIHNFIILIMLSWRYLSFLPKTVTKKVGQHSKMGRFVVALFDFQIVSFIYLNF